MRPGHRKSILVAEAVIKIVAGEKNETDQKFLPISRIIGPRQKLLASPRLPPTYASGFSIKL